MRGVYEPVLTHDVRNPLYMEELVGALEKQQHELLEATRKDAVLISPCISLGKREIARVVLDTKLPLIALLENGFLPIYKPPKYYFEVCAEGRLLMLVP